MTTWIDVINFVRARYEVLQETNDGWLRFRLETEDGRTQQVALHHLTGEDSAELVEISSPVGWADKIDVPRLLELAATTTAGGAAVVDGVALLRHTVPLADLSIHEEFERPMLQLVAHADAFEDELTKGDEF